MAAYLSLMAQRQILDDALAWKAYDDALIKEHIADAEAAYYRDLDTRAASQEGA